MKNRVMTQAYVMALVFGLPLWFMLWRFLLMNFLGEVTFEDGAIEWLDTTLHLPTELNPDEASSFWERWLAGGSRRVLVDVLTLPFLVWVQRFQAAALEEMRLSFDVTPLVGVQIGARWIMLGFLALLLPPYGAILLYRVLQLAHIWEPVALLLAGSLFLFLSFWSYQLPNRRLEHLQTVHAFEKLRRCSTT